MTLTRYDKYAQYNNEQLPMVVNEAEGKVQDCTDCGWHHEHIDFLVDPVFKDKYFICPMTEKEVVYIKE